MLGYGQQAGGTHPTGMHSCFINRLTDLTLRKITFSKVGTENMTDSNKCLLCLFYKKRLTDLTLNWSSKHLSPTKRRWAILKGLRIGGFMKKVMFPEGNTALLNGNNMGSPNGSNSSIPSTDVSSKDK